MSDVKQFWTPWETKPMSGYADGSKRHAGARFEARFMGDVQSEVLFRNDLRDAMAIVESAGKGLVVDTQNGHYSILKDASYRTETYYEKCRDCHLFVDPNSAYEPGSDIAEFIHLARGNAADDAIEETHDAVPSGMRANIPTWQVFGPVAMRERFVTPSEYAGF